MVMDRVTVGVLLLAFCKGAWAQTSGGNSNLSLWNSGSGFGGGVTSMMMIIGARPALCPSAAPRRHAAPLPSPMMDEISSDISDEGGRGFENDSSI